MKGLKKDLKPDQIINMNKPIKNILCYSHYDFDRIMENNNWIDYIPLKYKSSVISICSPNEGGLSEHWFKTDCNTKGHGVYHYGIYNLDIDDASPFWFENHESECYDKALDLYKNGNKKMSNAYFNHIYISGENKQWVDMLHVLDYEEACDLVEWIDRRIKKDNTIYIHCAVGASRSQGVVRYIVDTYGNDYDIRLNPNNPNDTYNPHVVIMLKRAYREQFDNNLDNSYFETEPMKFNEDIKLNLL